MPRLLRRFSIISFIAFVVVATALGAIYRHFAEASLIRNVEQNNLQLARSFSNSLWPQYESFMARASHMSADDIRRHPQTARLLQDVLGHTQGLPVIKLKIYDTHRKVLFSTDSSEIGNVKPVGYLGDITVVEGIAVSKLDYREKFDGIQGTLHERNIVGTYLPIHHDPHPGIEAVMEIYSDVTNSYKTVRREQWRIISLFIILLLGLYLLLFTVVRRADLKIKEQIEQLEFARLEEKALNEILQTVNPLLPLEQQLDHSLKQLFTVPWIGVQKKGSIFLVKDRPDELEMVAQHGLSIEIKTACKKIQSGNCLCGQAAESRSPVYAEHLDHRHTTTYDGIIAHGHACLPIVSGDNLLGVLNLYTGDGYRLSDANKQFLKSVTTALAWIIENKQSTIKLTESEKKFRNIVESLPDAFIAVDERGIIVNTNDHVNIIFGYEKHELIGKDMEILLPENMRARHRPLQQGYIRHPETRPMGANMELLARHKDGSLIPVEISLSPITSETGTLVTTIVRDISDRKRDEKKLVWLASFPEMNPQPIIELDDNDAITFMNPAAHDWFPDMLKLGVSHPILSLVGPVKDIPISGQAPPTFVDIVVDSNCYQLNMSRVPDTNLRRIGVWDITMMYRLTKKLGHQASHDSLTGLINRAEFETRLDQMLVSARNENKVHSLLYIDLDQFKVVNDTCGHVAGDELLKQLTALLLNTVRDSDTLARLGGDEFAVLLRACPLDMAAMVAEKLRKLVEEFTFAWENKRYQVGASIGVAPITSDSLDLAAIMSSADSACYEAKEGGRNQVHVFQPDDATTARLHGQMLWVPRIRQALDENRFVLYAQRILPMTDKPKSREHFEILIRMQDEDGNIVPPGAFLPPAERYNLMPAIDRWVIRETFDALQTKARHMDFCAINLSGLSFTDIQFQNYVVDQIQHYDIEPQRICFEITETAAVSSVIEATRFINTLHDLGCLFALDDFGSGLSSFAYLRTLPVDFLKIDGSFVQNILSDHGNRTIVQMVNQFGHTLGMKTIAEFVENAAILALLREIGVDYAQGYGIAKPQPLDETFSVDKKQSNP